MRTRFFISILVILYTFGFAAMAAADPKGSSVVSGTGQSRMMLINQELDRLALKNSSGQPLQNISQLEFSADAKRAFQEQKENGNTRGQSLKRFSGYAKKILLTSSDGSSERHMKPLSMDIGIERQNYGYTEPGISVKTEGDHTSIGGIATYRAVLDGEVMEDGRVRSTMNSVSSVDVRIFEGTVDYKGSGTYDDIDDHGYEIRAMTGVEWFSPRYLLNPYLGIGMRKLYNEFAEVPASTIDGVDYASGYDRDSKYVYMPVGVTVTKYFKNNWSFSINGEYDHLFNGEQISHLDQSKDASGASAGYLEAKNKQDDGYGFRFSVRLSKNFGRYDLYVEPFFRFWHIDDSNQALVYDFGSGVGLYGMEPENKTKEFGLKMGVNF